MGRENGHFVLTKDSPPQRFELVLEEDTGFLVFEGAESLGLSTKDWLLLGWSITPVGVTPPRGSRGMTPDAIALARGGLKINAIKQMRTDYPGMSLNEAKSIVDKFFTDNGL